MYQKPLKKPSGLILTAWEEELYDDPCRNFILDGIKNGFHIIDPTMSPQWVELPNHPSATKDPKLISMATDQIELEIKEGNYVQVPSPPVIVSPLGIIPKSDGGIRIIHDCSRPKGEAVNDYVSNSH